jgi:hypothetical protein
MIARSRGHLADAGEPYFEHLRFAMTVGLMALAAGLALLGARTNPRALPADGEPNDRPTRVCCS